MSQNLTLDYEIDDALADQVAALAIGPKPQGYPPSKVELAKWVAIVGGAVLIMSLSGIQWTITWQVIFPVSIMGIAVAFPFGVLGLLHLLRLVASRRTRRAMLIPFVGLPHRRVSWAFTERGFT